MDELSPQQCAIYDPFWTPRLVVNSSRAVFHQWQQLENSGCIDNFCIAAGELDGLREGWFFADSDAYKWLDAAARIYQSHPDHALVSLMDDFISLLERAQDDDGYLFTYNQVHFPGTRWNNLLIEHELYCHGHLVEAGVSHFEAVGQTRMLTIARKAADRVTADFIGKGPAFTPGHEEIEIALLRLYQVTGHQPYLAMARQFLEQRGRRAKPAHILSLVSQLRDVAKRQSTVRHARQAYIAQNPTYHPRQVPPGNYFKTAPGARLRWLVNSLDGKFFQQHAPIRQQVVPVGHSVRFGYLETAVAMLHRLTGDASLLPPMEAAWQRMVSRRMYITGGVGSVPLSEGFGRDYELDPEYAYAETCASLASMFWSWQMAHITSQAKYSDLFEWQLYNAAAVGMGLEGTNYLFNNPLVCRGGITRQDWYAVPCCPSNLSRTWADLGKYIYSIGPRAIWVHQYIGSQASLPVEGDINLNMQSGFPWNGDVRITVRSPAPAEFTLHLRVPSWVSDPEKFTNITVNGTPATGLVRLLPTSPAHIEPAAQGYDPGRSYFVSLQRLWSPGDVLELHFDMPITIRRTSRKVRGHRGKVAVTRGPLVYCLESTDNRNVDIFSTQLDTSSLVPVASPELLGGITTLHGNSTDSHPLVFIPYHLWANRGESQMTVWING